MAKYKSIVITNAALELIAAAHNGGTIEFTGIKTGNGTYDGSEVLADMTDLKSEQQSFGITGLTRTAAVIKARSVLNNNDLTAGYYITEIGLYAMDPSTRTEILYAIIVAESGMEDYLPAYADSPQSITLEMYVSAAGTEDVNFTASIIPGTYVTVEDFNDFIVENTGKLLLKANQVDLEQTNQNIANLSTELNEKINTAQSTAETAEDIAKGKNRARVFNTTEDMYDWLSDEANKGVAMKGDNIYIIDLGVPDWWIADVLDAPNADGRYYEVAQLETQKVDLTTINEAIAELNAKNKYIFICDSYDPYVNLVDTIATYLGISTDDYYNLSVSGTGFNEGQWGNMLTTFITNNPDVLPTITHIVVCGGLNDSTTAYAINTYLFRYISEFAELVKDNFPKAKFYLGYIGNALDDYANVGNRTRENRLNACMLYQEVATYGGIYLHGVENIMHDLTLFHTDGIHPNSTGGFRLAQGIVSALNSGSCSHISRTQKPSMTASTNSPAASYTVNVFERIINNVVNINFRDLIASYGTKISITGGNYFEFGKFSNLYLYNMEEHAVQGGMTINGAWKNWDGKMKIVNGVVYIMVGNLTDGGYINYDNVGLLSVNSFNITIPTLLN